MRGQTVKFQALTALVVLIAACLVGPSLGGHSGKSSNKSADKSTDQPELSKADPVYRRLSHDFSDSRSPSFEGSLVDECYKGTSATGKSHIDSADIHRIVVIGDTHGDANAILNSLFAAGVVFQNKDKTYAVPESAKHTLVVQTGDVVDRGPEDLESILLLDKFEARGLRIARLSGNHELLWMQGQFKYAALPGIESKKKDIASCDGTIFRRFYNQVVTLLLTHPAHEERLVFAHGGVAPGVAELAEEVTAKLIEKAEEVSAEESDYYSDSSDSYESGYDSSTSDSDSYSESMLLQTGERAQAHLRSRGREDGYDESGYDSEESLPESFAFEMTAESDFLSLDPKERLGLVINTINELMRSDIELLCAKMNAEEVDTVFDQFKPKSLPSGATTTGGLPSYLNRVSRWHQTAIRELREKDKFKELFKSCSSDDDDQCVSPVWYRGYSLSSRNEADRCNALDEVVNTFERLDPGITTENFKMIMGHTQYPAGIASICNGRMFDVDVGMSKAWQSSSYKWKGAALVIDGWNEAKPRYSWVGVSRDGRKHDVCKVLAENRSGELAWQTAGADRGTGLCGGTGSRIKPFKIKKDVLGTVMPVCNLDRE